MPSRGAQAGTERRSLWVGKQDRLQSKMCPVARTTSKQSSLCFDFFLQKSHPPASLLLLFHKKSRSAHLFGCKRPLNGAPSLPTFCVFFYLTRRVHSHHVEAKFALLRLFLQKSHPPVSLLLLFHKKSRSAHLFGCKRPHNGSPSLPTFCVFF